MSWTYTCDKGTVCEAGAHCSASTQARVSGSSQPRSGSRQSKVAARSCSPSTTAVSCGVTQWAAVTTWRGETNTPPHSLQQQCRYIYVSTCLRVSVSTDPSVLLYCSSATQGHMPGLVASPAPISPLMPSPLPRSPHRAQLCKIYNVNNKRVVQYSI